MPDDILLKAYQAKQAVRDCIAHRAALALAEIESAERHKDYFSAIHGRHQGRVAVTDQQLDVLALLLDHRELSDVENDGGYHRTMYADELNALMTAQIQAIQMEELVRSRAGSSHQDDDATSSAGSSHHSDDGGNVPFTGLL